MNVKKRLYALCAACGVFCGTLAGGRVSGVPDGKADTPVFTDVAESDWFYPYVTALAATGTLQGVGGGLFLPDDTFTVAEAATVVTRYLGLEADAERLLEAWNARDDVPDAWYAGYAGVLAREGVLDGARFGVSVRDGALASLDASRLEAPIYRFEFADLVSRSFAYADGKNGGGFRMNDPEKNASDERYAASIADFAAIPVDFRSSVIDVYREGIFCGDQYRDFHPLDPLSRAEMAKVVTVVTDKSLRSWVKLADEDVPAMATVTDGFAESDYVTDMGGVKHLKITAANTLLADAFGDMTLTASGETLTVSYTPKTTAPEGFVLRFYHFHRLSYGFDEDKAAKFGNIVDTAYRETASPTDRFALVLFEADKPVSGVTVSIENGVLVLHSDRYLP